MSERKSVPFRLHAGSCLDVLREYPDAYFDSCVTDPPYNLGFMGREWDRGGVANDPKTWLEVLRVLKPGAHLLAFGGTRTWHRMVCAIEDAGFEIRDSVMYLYGSGFPKSYNLDNERGEAICGCSTATERDMRPVLDSDVSPPFDTGEERGEVLQSGMSQQGTSTHRQASIFADDEGLAQPRVEGRSDAAASPRELRAGAVRKSARVGAADGTQGRLHHGAPARDGGMVRLPADENGSRASRRPRSSAQQAAKPRVMAGQSESQVGGAWPTCGGCGKPLLPEGLGSALKPAWEPVVVARKPFKGTILSNVLAFGTGALNIDGCRIGTEGGRRSEGNDERSESQPGAIGSYEQSPLVAGLGRWPANVATDGSDEVLAAFPHAPGAMAPVTGNEPSSSTSSVFGEYKRAASPYVSSGGAGRKAAWKGTGMLAAGSVNVGVRDFGDGGSAARFFYSAKASQEDRHEGLEEFVAANNMRVNAPRANEAEKFATKGGNTHPTVKGTELMRWLCRLVTPPGGRIVDPFCGSGSTGKAAMLEGFRFTGIDLDATHIDISRARILHAIWLRERANPLGF